MGDANVKFAPLVWVVTTPFAIVFFVHLSVGLLLGIWRSCDRCSYHLYPYTDVGQTGMILRSMSRWRYPHSRTERLLGSLRWGVIVSMAQRGVAHCMWCGHLDGAKLYETAPL